MDYFNTHILFNISVYILLISTVIHSLELLIIPRDFIALGYHEKRKIKNHTLWRLIHLVLLFVTLCSFLIFLLQGLSTLFRWVIVFNFFIIYYSYLIRVTGKDGADQFRAISFMVLTISFLTDNENAKVAYLTFTALQLLLAYTTSGTIKLLSPYWRKGNVLAPILSTYSFGFSPFAQWLRKKPLAEKLFSYGAIFSMLSVIVAFFIPNEWILIGALGGMFTFHIATTVLMGLNDFVLTLPLAYPGVLFLHQLYVENICGAMML